MYKVIRAFVDLQDDRFMYNVGDEYPRNGLTVSDSRVKELLSGNNRSGMALITHEDASSKPSEPEGDAERVDPGVDRTEPVETKEKPRRRRKKNA